MLKLKRPTRQTACLIPAVVLAACAGKAEEDQEAFQVSDSAGIEIVLNTAASMDSNDAKPVDRQDPLENRASPVHRSWWLPLALLIVLTGVLIVRSKAGDTFLWKYEPYE